MKSIRLRKSELDYLDIINNSGIEANISIYRKTRNKLFIDNYNLLKDKVIKSYKDNDLIRDTLNDKEYHDYIENKHQKVLLYSKMNPSNFKVFNIILGPIYLNKNFFASYQAYIQDSCTLFSKCYNTKSKDYANIDFITDVTNQMQQGIMEELHPNKIYTDDFSIGNMLIDKNNKLHFIDGDCYKVNNLPESSYFYRRFYDEDFCYISLRKNPKYLDHGFVHACRDRDIFSTYVNFIELVSKEDITELSETDIYSLLTRSNFPKEFNDYFLKCFSKYEKNEFIPLDILNKIKTDYKIDICSNGSYCYGKLKRK